MTPFDNALFNRLPLEMNMEIFSYLDTLDLVNICDLYDIGNYFKDHRHIRTLNFVGLSKIMKRLPMDSSFLQNINLSYITVLNVNFLHWLTAPHLMNVFKQFPFLKELYCLGTKIILDRSFWLVCVGMLQLETLAVNIHCKTIPGICEIEQTLNLKKLCFQISSEHELTSEAYLIVFYQKFTNLKEVWIIDNGATRMEYGFLLNHLSNLDIFSVSSKCALEINIDRLHPNFIKIFNRNQYCNDFVLAKQNANMAAPKHYPWNLFSQVHNETITCLRDTRKLWLNHRDTSGVKLRELNFCHKTCTKDYCEAVMFMLESNQVNNLKRLGLSSCFFSCHFPKQSPMKKKKLACSYDVITKRTRLLDNLQQLECIEVTSCKRHHGPEAYALARYLKNIREINFQIEHHMDGSFLEKIFKHCTKLEKLNIDLKKPNELLNTYCSGHFGKIKSLKTLRYSHYRVSFNRLFHSLAKLSKLEKVFLIFNHVDNINLTTFEQFLRNNPLLEQLVVVITGATEKEIKRMRKSAKKYKRSEDQVFNVSKVRLERFDFLVLRSSRDYSVADLNPLTDFPLL